MSFADLGLRAELVRAVAAQNYTTPTPVQRQAIPGILEGRDLLAGAQTGTGKTAAFTLPLLQRLHENVPEARGARPVRALVLTPTRELAAQVGESVQTYGQFLPLKSAIVFGGVGIGPQIKALRRGVDILIATPGRLLDLIDQRVADLSTIEVLVLDEADRMLDMGFIRDIRRIMKHLPAKRQNLLFSATYSAEIRTLASDILKNPLEVEVARRNTAAETVSQAVYHVEKKAKRDLLAHLIDSQNWFQVLVFTRTKHGADRLARQLTNVGIESMAIHGNKSQNARTRALAAFKSGELRVLVATDIAARGIDIDRLPHVVNYELPNVAEDYVHRIGRTGRAGENGSAVSLVDAEERKLLKGIERLIKREIDVLPLPEFARSESAQAETESQPRANRGRAPSAATSGNGANSSRRRQGSRGQGAGQNAQENRDGRRQDGQSRADGRRRDGANANPYANGQSRGQGASDGQARNEGRNGQHHRRSRAGSGHASENGNGNGAARGTHNAHPNRRSGNARPANHAGRAAPKSGNR